MKVELLQHSSLQVCAQAIRTCWQSFDKSDNGGDKDKELIDRIGNQYKHSSTLEHLSYTFYISDVSRALLQELARHRMASPSVKSTRYTLKELKDEESFTVVQNVLYKDLDSFNKEIVNKSFKRASKYLVFTDNEEVDMMSLKALENLRLMLVQGISNDIAKYCLPESYKTELTWTINARSLQNFLSLRSSKAALWEIRDLANLLYNTLPEEHMYLFDGSINE
jgi:thymidylate synthase (FAD)